MNQTDMTNLKILVVDDEPSVRQSLQMVLTHLGHAVQTIDTGAMALDLVVKNPFDLIIIDYFMPDMKGDELARLIKQNHPGLPILMITAYAEVFLADHRYAGLVDALLSKPFDIPKLQEAMVQALRQPIPTAPAA